MREFVLFLYIRLLDLRRNIIMKKSIILILFFIFSMLFSFSCTEPVYVTLKININSENYQSIDIQPEKSMEVVDVTENIYKFPIKTQVTITVTPEDGYETDWDLENNQNLTPVIDDPNSVKVVLKEELTELSPGIVTKRFAINTTMSPSTDAGSFTISPEGEDGKWPWNTTITVTPTNNLGYKINNITVNGDSNTTFPVTFTMPKNDVDLVFNFDTVDTDQSITISYTDGTNPINDGYVQFTEDVMTSCTITDNGDNVVVEDLSDGYELQLKALSNVNNAQDTLLKFDSWDDLTGDDANLAERTVTIKGDGTHPDPIISYGSWPIGYIEDFEDGALESNKWSNIYSNGRYKESLYEGYNIDEGSDTVENMTLFDEENYFGKDTTGKSLSFDDSLYSSSGGIKNEFIITLDVELTAGTSWVGFWYKTDLYSEPDPLMGVATEFKFKDAQFWRENIIDSDGDGIGDTDGTDPNYNLLTLPVDDPDLEAGKGKNNWSYAHYTLKDSNFLEHELVFKLEIIGYAQGAYENTIWIDNLIFGPGVELLDVKAKPVVELETYTVTDGNIEKEYVPVYDGITYSTLDVSDNINDVHVLKIKNDGKEDLDISEILENSGGATSLTIVDEPASVKLLYYDYIRFTLEPDAGDLNINLFIDNTDDSIDYNASMDLSIYPSADYGVPVWKGGYPTTTLDDISLDWNEGIPPSGETYVSTEIWRAIKVNDTVPDHSEFELVSRVSQTATTDATALDGRSYWYKLRGAYDDGSGNVRFSPFTEAKTGTSTAVPNLITHNLNEEWFDDAAHLEPINGGNTGDENPQWWKAEVEPGETYYLYWQDEMCDYTYSFPGGGSDPTAGRPDWVDQIAPGSQDVITGYIRIYVYHKDGLTQYDLTAPQNYWFGYPEKPIDWGGMGEVLEVPADEDEIWIKVVPWDGAGIGGGTYILYFSAIQHEVLNP